MLRRLLPTAHKLLLNRLIEPKLRLVDGDVLVIGSGKETYRALISAATSVCCTDMEDGENIDIVADVHALPFQDGSFDVVVAIEVFEHLRDPRLATSEANRVLRSSGKLILTIPFMFRVHGDPHDYQRFTSSGLDVLLKEHFLPIIEPFGNRTQVVSDLLTTAFKALASVRFVNHLLCLRPLAGASLDCPSGFLVEATKKEV